LLEIKEIGYYKYFMMFAIIYSNIFMPGYIILQFYIME